MFEYQVIPAPRRGKKARGVRGTEARFALAMQDLLNDAAADGWEYVRTDTLPSEERSGLTGRTTIYQNLLVFRRAIAQPQAVEPAIAAATPVIDPVDDMVATDDNVEIAIEEFDLDGEEPNAPALPSADEANAVPENVPEIERDR